MLKTGLFHFLNERWRSCGNTGRCTAIPVSLNWIEKQFEKLLPVPYFFLTFPLPEEFRGLFRSHQLFFYDLFFKTSSQALKDLAKDKRFAGGEIGFWSILHTWSRTLIYHPHIHYIVPGVALSSDHKRFLKIKNKRSLIHVKPLGIRFKYLFQKALKETEFYDQIPKTVWEKDWVVHCEHAGSGQKIIKYVALYVYRIAISNHRIIKLENRKVTFWYKDSKTNETKTCTLEVIEFIRRFLQHILPAGFIKIRYFSIMGSNIKAKWLLIKYLLVQYLSRQGKSGFLNIQSSRSGKRTPYVPNAVFINPS